MCTYYVYSICGVFLSKAFLLTHPNPLKALSPGRVVTVHTAAYGHALAVVLQQHAGRSTRSFTVLTLCESGDEWEERSGFVVGDTSSRGSGGAAAVVGQYRAMSGLFAPGGEVRHTVVDIDGQSIHNITEEVVDVEAKKIIDDYNKRQIPRFRQEYIYYRTTHV